MQIVPISTIEISDRHRVDLGDLLALAKSMEEHGLLNPVIIDTNRRLVCGQRRIEAAKLLGWASIDARIINLDNPLQAELDENELRKPFTVSERVAILKALNARIDKPLDGHITPQMAAQRRELGLPESGRAYDTMAEKAGLESRSYAMQAEKVVDNAHPSIVEMVDSGSLTVQAGSLVADLPKEQQAELAQKGPEAVRDEAQKRRKILVKPSDLPVVMRREFRRFLNRFDPSIWKEVINELTKLMSEQEEFYK